MTPSLVALAAALGPGFLARLGQALGGLWVIYGLVLFLFTIWGLTPMLLAFFSYLAFRRRQPRRLLRRLILPFELFFCFANPLAYLLILVHSSGDREFFLDARSSWLDPLAWLVLVLLWTLRFAPFANPERRRRWVRALLLVGLGLIAAYLSKDAAGGFADPASGLRNLPRSGPTLLAILYLVGLLALYLVPAAILLRFLRSSRSPESWQRAGFVLLPRRAGAALLLTLSGLALLSLGLLTWRPSDAQVEARILSTRTEILRAASMTGTDPRLLAALAFVVQRRQVSPFGSALEAMLTETWLSDATSHVMLSDSLNLSIGLAQIKPVTAQTTLLVVEHALNPQSFYSKEYRDVPRLGPS